MVGVNDENSVGNEHFKADLFTEDHRRVCLPKRELSHFIRKIRLER